MKKPDINDLLEQMNSSGWNNDFDILSEEEQQKELKKKARLLKQTRYKTDTWVRITLALSTQLIIIGWVVLSFILLFNNGRRYGLSDTVICTLLGATTANIVGLAIIVLNGYFKFMKQDVVLDEKNE